MAANFTRGLCERAQLERRTVEGHPVSLDKSRILQPGRIGIAREKENFHLTRGEQAINRRLRPRAEKAKKWGILRGPRMQAPGRRT